MLSALISATSSFSGLYSVFRRRVSSFKLVLVLCDSPLQHENKMQPVSLRSGPADILQWQWDVSPSLMQVVVLLFM